MLQKETVPRETFKLLTELMKGNYNWKAIENRLKQMILQKDKIFEEKPTLEISRRRR